MGITVLLVEDDPAMVRVLTRVIVELGYARIVGQTGDGHTAGRMFRELRPQVVFVDIDLPGKSGIEVAREVFDLCPWTYIVFATAFADYRDEAFDVYAFDYIVKPFKIARIRQTMERIKLLVSGRATGEQMPPAALPRDPVRRKLSFKDGEKYVLVRSDEIIFATRENRRSVLYLADRTIQVNKGLAGLEEDLGGYPFYRCHKGFIVNLEMIREFIPSGNTTYEVVMAGTTVRPLITWEKVKEINEMIAKGVLNG